VIQLDPLVEDALDRALPEPHERAPEWDDVLRRADVTLFARKAEGASAGLGCYLVTSQGSEAEECREPGEELGFMFTGGGFPGSDALAVLLFGQASPRVATLELELGDGARERLDLVRGYFLYELDRRHWDDARLWLVARDPNGRRLARERVVRSGL
jgi:hypothetical protein